MSRHHYARSLQCLEELVEMLSFAITCSGCSTCDGRDDAVRFATTRRLDRAVRGCERPAGWVHDVSFGAE